MSIYIEDKNGKRRKFAGVGSEKDYIDDGIASEKMTWSSEKILDTLCPPFTETGNPITCNPVEGYPLGVTVTMEPIQAGTGDPSPDNVRPISGRDSVQVTRCGKNLLKLTERTVQSRPADFQAASENTKYPIGDGYLYVGVTSNGYWTEDNITEYDIADNSISVNATNLGYGIGMCVKIVPGASYVIGKDGDDTNAIMSVFTTKKDGLISRFTVVNTAVNDNNKFTAQDGEEWAIVIFRPASNSLVTYQNPQLELGSTPTAYEPYQPGTTATLTFPETIYGGTVDAVTGAGSKEYYNAEFTGEENWRTWGYNHENNLTGVYLYLVEESGIFYPPAKPTTTSYSNLLPYNNNAYSNDLGQRISGLEAQDQYFVMTFNTEFFQGVTNDEEVVPYWKNYLVKQFQAGTPVQICYQLATPEPFQATGNRPLSALPGTNTLYTDGNSLTVSGSTSPISAIESFKADVQASANQAEAVANILLGGA